MEFWWAQQYYDGARTYCYAEFLKQNPNRQVRVEGNADEQGSREYNIAFGENVRYLVAQALHAQGVTSRQISTVSYGREKPDVMGHSERSLPPQSWCCDCVRGLKYVWCWENITRPRIHHRVGPVNTRADVGCC